MVFIALLIMNLTDPLTNKQKPKQAKTTGLVENACFMRKNNCNKVKGALNIEVQNSLFDVGCNPFNRCIDWLCETNETYN